MKKILVAALASLPVGCVGCCNAGFAANQYVGLDGRASYEPWMVAFILLGFVAPLIGSTVYAARARTTRLVASRAARVFTFMIFLAPLFVIGQCIATPPVSDPIFPVWSGVLVAMFIAMMLGGMGLIAAKGFKRGEPPEEPLFGGKVGKVVWVGAVLAVIVGAIVFVIAGTEAGPCSETDWPPKCEFSTVQGYIFGLSAALVTFAIVWVLALVAMHWKQITASFQK